MASKVQRKPPVVKAKTPIATKHAPAKQAPAKDAPTKPASTKPASTKPASTKPASTKHVEVRSFEARLAEVTDRSEMLAARVGALELGLRKVLKHWPQGRGKLRKDLVARAKRVGKGLDNVMPAADRPTWQQAIDDLIAAID